MRGVASPGVFGRPLRNVRSEPRISGKTSMAEMPAVGAQAIRSTGRLSRVMAVLEGGGLPGPDVLMRPNGECWRPTRPAATRGARQCSMRPHLRPRDDRPGILSRLASAILWRFQAQGGQRRRGTRGFASASPDRRAFVNPARDGSIRAARAGPARQIATPASVTRPPRRRADRRWRRRTTARASDESRPRRPRRRSRPSDDIRRPSPSTIVVSRPRPRRARREFISRVRRRTPYATTP